METATRILPIIQIVVSILLIVTIALQQSAAGVGGALGGSDSAVAFRTRRGFERFLFTSTIILAILFFVTALIAVLA